MFVMFLNLFNMTSMVFAATGDILTQTVDMFDDIVR